MGGADAGVVGPQRYRVAVGVVGGALAIGGLLLERFWAWWKARRAASH